MCFDNQDQILYFADCFNHRIVEWRLNAITGRIVVGANGQGTGLDQLDRPIAVIIDRQNNDLIIADRGNRRVIRYSRQKDEHREIIIENIDCHGLAMHRDGSLYVADWKNNEVRRWKNGETQGTIVAGGNGQGNRLNQLNFPNFVFIDDDHSLYVSDENNHRVMKWTSGAKEGIVVAGGNGQGNENRQLCHPQGVLVDEFGQIYVGDCENHRVMRWCEEAKEGMVVIGGNDRGQGPNQLDYPVGLSLDDEGNLYVVENGNDRVQKLEIEPAVKQN